MYMLQQKQAGGRPTKCTPEKLAKSREYLNKYSDLGDVVPTIEGLALHIGVTRKTVYNWTKNPKNQEFLHIYESCMCQQSITLINKGLMGELNFSLCAMMLTRHGYGKERQSKIVYVNEEPSQEDKARLDLILKN